MMCHLLIGAYVKTLSFAIPSTIMMLLKFQLGTISYYFSIGNPGMNTKMAAVGTSHSIRAGLCC